MKDWQNLLVSLDSPLVHAIRIIDSGGGQIAIVVDDDGHLLGTITDADVRKALLGGWDFHTEPCGRFMSDQPISLDIASSKADRFEVMRRRHIRQLPLVDNVGRVADVVLLMDMMGPDPRSNPVVIMAGGLGTRLAPLTHHHPKPLLKVGEKPILETIIEQFVAHGFGNFFLSVNYKAKMIMDHFGDGSRWNVDIRYLLESECLGTAGALSLLPRGIDNDVVVMNGDILTKIDFCRLLNFHESHESSITMAVKDCVLTVPYGVVVIDEHGVVNTFQEKPSHRFFINAGIYVLAPGVLRHVPKDQYFDMPGLIDAAKRHNMKTSAFPIHEYWMDIGLPKDFEQANYDFNAHFNGPASASDKECA